MKRDVWIFLFIFGLLLFGWPLLTVFHDHLVSYLFAAWAGFILLIYLATLYEGRGGDGGG